MKRFTYSSLIVALGLVAFGLSASPAHAGKWVPFPFHHQGDSGTTSDGDQPSEDTPTDSDTDPSEGDNVPSESCTTECTESGSMCRGHCFIAHHGNLKAQKVCVEACVIVYENSDSYCQETCDTSSDTSDTNMECGEMSDDSGDSSDVDEPSEDPAPTETGDSSGDSDGNMPTEDTGNSDSDDNTGTETSDGNSDSDGNTGTETPSEDPKSDSGNRGGGHRK